tara:strand:+ start:4578 stop:4844 length:267 start_codon:yes stop_codon:yes gene_type:complete
LLASGVGNIIAKVPAVDDLSDPKSNTTTALSLCELLYINAPLAVIEELVKEVSAKSVKAVVPPDVGVVADKVLPPAEYPVPLVSFDVE